MTGPKHSPYLKDALNETGNVVRLAIETLTPIGFEALVVTGVSGMLIGPIVAHLMGKRLAVIRKSHELNHIVSHAEIMVETNMKAGDRWVFFDDLIASGQTIQRAHLAMDEVGRPEGVGHYLYNCNEFTGGRWN